MSEQGINQEWEAVDIWDRALYRLAAHNVNNAFGCLARAMLRKDDFDGTTLYDEWENGGYKVIEVYPPWYNATPTVTKLPVCPMDDDTLSYVASLQHRSRYQSLADRQAHIIARSAVRYTLIKQLLAAYRLRYRLDDTDQGNTNAEELW